MRLSAKSDYALRALTDLAENYNVRLVQTREIASRHRIPEKFLEQILRDLKNGGVVVSRSGIHGGYRLSRSPEKITFGEVIRLFEGSLAPLGCVSVGQYIPCPEESMCRFQMVMRRVRDAVAGILETTNLADVTPISAPSIPPASAPMYYI